MCVSPVLMQSAYVDGLENTELFLNMFKDDVDAHKIEHLPDLTELLRQ